MHILILGGISRSLINFRGPLIRDMLAQGHEVIACAGEPLPEVAETLKAWGVRFVPVPLARAGMNPFHDLRLCLKLVRVFRQLRPDAIFSYTIKPVIWGSLAARIARIPNSFALVTGLGYAFMDQTADCRPQTAHARMNSRKDAKTQSLQHRKQAPKNQETRTPFKQRLASYVAKRLYKASLKHSSKVFFQNPDDARQFVQLGLVSEAKCCVVSGSGIDLDQFKTESEGRKTEASAQTSANTKFETLIDSQTLSTAHRPLPTVFLLIARLLRDKGICEYAEAAAIIKREYPDAEFHLVGDYDPNPAGLKPANIEAWVNAGTIIYHGQQADVRPFLRDCSVYVLPSYREGTPRTVLEAMATGRPVITTDAPGCRETVRFQTGLSAVALAKEEDSRPQTAHARMDSRKDAKTQSLQHRKQAPKNQETRTKNLLFGENGILIPPRNAAALSEAMRFFIEQPEQVASMGRASRQYAEECYDVRKVNAVILREMGM